MVGKELTFDDDTGEEPIEIWLSKISPIEQRDAADQATKARAKILSLKNAPDAESERLLYEDQLDDLGLFERDDLITFLATSKIEEARVSNEQRIAAEDPWSKDDYLNSLQSAWNDGLMDEWVVDPEANEEAARVYSELKRFTEEVEEAMIDDVENIKSEFDQIDDEKLRKDAIDKILESEADFAWMNEFSYYQVFYAVRYPDDHKLRYFESVDEVKCIDTRILSEIIREYREMTVEGVEGKD
jgi:hypothetical protein